MFSISFFTSMKNIRAIRSTLANVDLFEQAVTHPFASAPPAIRVARHVALATERVGAWDFIRLQLVGEFGAGFIPSERSRKFGYGAVWDLSVVARDLSPAEFWSSFSQSPRFPMRFMKSVTVSSLV